MADARGGIPPGPRILSQVQATYNLNEAEPQLGAHTSRVST